MDWTPLPVDKPILFKSYCAGDTGSNNLFFLSTSSNPRITVLMLQV